MLIYCKFIQELQFIYIILSIIHFNIIYWQHDLKYNQHHHLLTDFDNDILIDYYAEGFIDLGYVILFAAAFPLGSIVTVLALCLEMKLKMFSFLYLFKRPNS